MRKIKFRLWDDDIIRMLTVVEMRSLCADEKIMQYVGIEDMDGREIYEGDILQSVSIYPNSGQSETLYEVIWEQSELRFALSSDSAIVDDTRTESFGWWIGNDWNKLKIVGNVYENPNLLKQNHHA